MSYRTSQEMEEPASVNILLQKQADEKVESSISIEKKDQDTIEIGSN